MQRHAAGERGFTFGDYLGVGSHAYGDQTIAYGSAIPDGQAPVGWQYQRPGYGG